MPLIKWKCPNCYTEYDVDSKFETVLADKKDCKFCVRKDPKIPTTAEMDGLLTQEDLHSRDQIVIQCFECLRWTQQTLGTEYTPCTAIVDGKPYIDGRNKVISGCGSTNYDPTSPKSLRTYNIFTDNKRKASTKRKK